VGSDTPLTLSSFHSGRSIWKMTRAFRPSIALTPVSARFDDMVRIALEALRNTPVNGD